MNTAAEIKAFIKNIIAQELKEPVESISETANFHEFGLDSINSVFLLDKVQLEFNVELTPLYFWDYPNIESFSNQIFKEIKDGSLGSV